MFASLNRFGVPLYLFLTLVTTAHAYYPEEVCHTATTLPLGSTVPFYGLDAGSTAFFALEVPAPGRVAVEVGTSGMERSLPWLEFLLIDCEGAGVEASGVRFLLSDPARQVLEVASAGTYYLQVGALDPKRSLASYYLSTHYVDFSQFDKDGEDGDDTEEAENEILPLVFEPPVAESCLPVALQFHKDGEDGDDTEEAENEILPLVFEPPVRGSESSQHCFPALRFHKDGEDGDDTEEAENEILPSSITPTACSWSEEPANDLSLFAHRLPLFGSVTSILRHSDLTDDHDFFAFDMACRSRIEVFTTGSTDTIGTLYDAYGHRLLSAEDGGEGENFSLAAQLGRGRYYVRVEGSLAAEGDYEIHLTATDL